MGKLRVMKSLQSYLNDLQVTDQVAFASRCGTTVGYLRKAISKGQQLGEKLVINMERESGGRLRCEELRPDVDWAYIRASATDTATAEAR